MTESELNFSAFVISLASSAAVHFGDLADASTGERQPPNLPAAKQMIDLLSLMEQKTKGNLDADEQQLLTQVLYELRLRFVQAATDEQNKSRIIP
jgi:hypothetical protein